MPGFAILAERDDFCSRVELDPSVAFDDPRSSEALKMRVPATGSAYGAILQQGTLKRAIRSAFSMRIAMYVSSLAIIGGLERWVIELNGYFNELGATCRLYILEGKQPPLLVPEAIRHLARFFDGDPARLAAAVRDDQIDVLVVHHAYAGLEAVDDPTLIVEVLHNIYFWQRDARSIRSLRRRFARVSPSPTRSSTTPLAILACIRVSWLLLNTASTAEVSSVRLRLIAGRQRKSSFASSAPPICIRKRTHWRY